MTVTRRFGAPALCILLLTALPSQAAVLKVDVSGLSSDAGDVHVALYDNPAGFPSSDGMRVEMQAPIHARLAQFTFADIPAGRYALAVYHDENGNHQFDQAIFGIPLEDYGFSNDARVFFAPPSFDEAAFEVAEPETRITVRLGR